MKAARVLSVIAATAISLGAAAVAADASDDGLRIAAGDIASCSADSERLLAVFLVDESGSLQESDPDDQRVTALQSTINQLAVLQSLRSELTIDLQIAGFSDGYLERLPWTSLDASGTETARSAVEAFRDQDQGVDTDYVLALEGAQAALAERASTIAAGESVCRAVFWFTDGKYDLTPRGGVKKPYAPNEDFSTQDGVRRVVDAGIESVLCPVDGLVDQLRRDKTTIFAVALTALINDPNDQAILEAIAEGRSSGRDCGTVPLPEGFRSGAYLPASDADRISLVLEDAISRGSGGTAVTEQDSWATCAEPGCADSAQIPLDGGVLSFRLRASAPDGVELAVQSPDGAVAQAGNGQEVLSGVSLTWARTGEEVSVSGRLLDPDSFSDGVWTVTAVAPEGSTAANLRTYLFPDAEPVLTEPPSLQAGEPSTLKIELRRVSNGSILDAGSFDAVGLNAAVQASGESAAIGLTPDGAAYSGGVTVPVDTSASQATVSLEAALTTTSGVQLSPVQRRTTLPLAPPSTFPSVTPTELTLPAIEKAGSTSATIALVGPAVGIGCVYVDENASGFETVPSAASISALEIAPAATSPGTCIRLDTQEEASLQVGASASSGGNGDAVGAVTLRLVDSSGQERPLVVPLRAPMVSPVDELVRWGLVAILLLLGLALPVAFMYLLNYWQGRFINPAGIAHAELPAWSLDAGPLRKARRPTAPVAEAIPDDFQYLSTSGGLRSFDVHGIDGLTFRAQVSRLPWEPPTALASAHTGASCLGSYRGSATRSDGGIEVPWDLRGHWIFVLAPEALSPSWDEDADTPPEISGTLHVFAPDDEPGRLELVRRAPVDAAHAALQVIIEARQKRAEVPESSDVRAGAARDVGGSWRQRFRRGSSDEAPGQQPGSSPNFDPDDDSWRF